MQCSGETQWSESQSNESLLAEPRLFARGLKFDELPGGVHYQIQIHIGCGILSITKIEHGLAVDEADALVQQVMRERGYPTKDFERRVADISVDHPHLVEKYRTAHGIAQASERNEASTEDLRHSVRHYRALFAELLEVDDGGVENVDDVTSRDEAEVDTRKVQRLR